MPKGNTNDTMPKTQHTKNRILDTAARTFYKHGYKATGVDTIAKAAGITKATLYHHFKNKDELIEESLKFLSEYHRGNYMKAWNKKGLSAHQRLTVLFDEMHNFFKEPDCYGCPFINAAGEYTERSSPVRRICESHYAFLTSHLEQFAHHAGLSQPRVVAEQITGCIAGAYSAWFVGGLKDAAKQGKKTSELIIAQHRRA
jgi:AcrR family transcriptional regulator